MPVCRTTSLFISIALTALLCACGPRSDNAAPAPYDAGARPGIVTSLYGVPTKLYAWEPDLNAGDLIFHVGYTLNVIDADANMRLVEVQVTWTPSCNTFPETWRVTEEIPSEFWLKEVLIEGVTTDAIEVPTGCLPEGNRFIASARIIDARGNYSNKAENNLTTLESQG